MTELDGVLVVVLLVAVLLIYVIVQLKRANENIETITESRVGRAVLQA